MKINLCSSIDIISSCKFIEILTTVKYDSVAPTRQLFTVISDWSRPHFSVTMVTKTAAETAVWVPSVTETVPKLWLTVTAINETEAIYPGVKLRSKLINANSLCSSSRWTRRQAKLARRAFHKHGTLCLLTLDRVILFRLSNANSKPTCSHSLNWLHQRLCIPIGPHGAIQMLYYYYHYYKQLYIGAYLYNPSNALAARVVESESLESGF